MSQIPESEIGSRSNNLGFLGQIPKRWNWVVRTTLNLVRTTLVNFQISLDPP
ncbi:hypothetical protein GIB67_020417, partial [Kingdonia uniflora]